MIIALMGPPGAGKGTQATELAKVGYTTFSVGEVLRQSSDSKISEARDTGELVDPGVVVDVVINKISSLGSDEKIVIDGFPRNLNQVSLFDERIAAIGRRLDAVIYISVPQKVSEERLRRRYEQFQRADDEPSVMKNRFIVFNRETTPAVESYRKRGLLLEIDGVGSVEEVASRVREALSAA